MNKLDNIQKSLHQTQEDVKQMKDFLLGNEFNGQQGLQSMLDDHDRRLVILEEHKTMTRVYADLMKWFFGIIITAMVGLVIFFVQKYAE
ncbi:MAG: hypothetical protein LC112_13820 [Flavobacteriales bacterium]|nr:hypothetical protein [Flavobacteriales bacterium]